MERRNVVIEGRYKGRTVVFSRGSLWINSGILSLVRLAPGTLEGARDVSAPDRVISLTFRDGTSSTLRLDEQLFRLGMFSLGLDGKASEVSEAGNIEERSGVDVAVKSGKGTERGTARTFLILLGTGAAAILLLRLLGKI